MSSHEAQSSSSRQANRSGGAFECIICMEVLVNPRVLPCGHSFCSSPKTCLSNLLKLKSPPQCASCNHKLPVNSSENDVPKNYALSSAIEETQASSEEGSKCPIHLKSQEFYCRPCRALICFSCWTIEHKDRNKHEVEPFSCYLEPYSDVQRKLGECRQETEKLTEMLITQVGKCSDLLDAIRKSEEVANKVLSSCNPATVNEQAANLREQVSFAELKLSDVEKFPVESFQEQLKNIRSKLTQTTPGDCSIVAITTTEWENAPEVPKFEKISLGNIGEAWCSAMDFGQQNLYVCSTRNSMKFVRRYEIDGETLIYRSEKEFGSIHGMCVVKDQLVILENFSKLELTMLDKYTLEVVEVTKIDLPVEQNELFQLFTIAGYADVLVVLLAQHKAFNRLIHRFALLRGKHIEILQNHCLESISGFSNRLFLCDKNTAVVYDFRGEPKLRFIEFNENEVTRTRCITIKDLIYISCASFKPLSMMSPLKGYLFIRGVEDAGSSSNCLKAVKVDLESVEDGATLPAGTIPELSGSQYFLSRSSAPAIVFNDNSETFLLNFVR